MCAYYFFRYTIQFNTIYYARRLILADRVRVTNAYVHWLVFRSRLPKPLLCHTLLILRLRFLKP
jgi:hypothetical protein